MLFVFPERKFWVIQLISWSDITISDWFSWRIIRNIHWLNHGNKNGTNHCHGTMQWTNIQNLAMTCVKNLFFCGKAKILSVDDGIENADDDRQMMEFPKVTSFWNVLDHIWRILPKNSMLFSWLPLPTTNLQLLI